MKVGTLIAGIIFLMLSAAGFSFLQESLNDCSSFIGQLGRAFSSDVSQNCKMTQLLLIGAAIFGVIGLGLMIGGAAAKGKKSEVSYRKNSRQYERDYEETRPRKTQSPQEKLIEDNLKNLGILKHRLAKGEISKQEYNELKQEFER